MYEHLRNEFQLKLSNHFSQADITFILSMLDGVASEYEVSTRETSLVVWQQEEMPHLVKLYLASLKLSGRADGTIKLYRLRLTTFFTEMQIDPLNITTRDIRNFLFNYKVQRDISDRSLDKFRQIINGFYVWLVDEEYITRNPAHSIKNIKFIPTPRRALSRVELETVRRNCTTPRELAIIDVLYSTGCRVNELVNMKFSDLDTQNKTVHIIGKGGKHNICFLNSNAILSLESYYATREDDCEYLFVSERGEPEKISGDAVRSMFKKLRKRCGFKFVPHTIRHTFATIALQNGMPLEMVQKCLGHSNPATTQIYAEIDYTELQRMHDRCVA